MLVFLIHLCIAALEKDPTSVHREEEQTAHFFIPSSLTYTCVMGYSMTDRFIL